MQMNEISSENSIRELLQSVKDPEIPTVSIIELGMVREIKIDEQGYTLIITPTFSGCPAKEVIMQSIQECLHKNGIEPLRIEIQLAPPWTVSDIDSICYHKLIKLGIAPPVKSKKDIKCPRCGSGKVTQISFFGSTSCKAHFSCFSCSEPFEYFKGIGTLTK